jgi:sugar phosphate permease
LSLVLLLQPILAIDTAGVTHSHARALLIIYGTEAADVINVGVSGLLMGVLIGFVMKNNRMVTTILALLLVTIIIIIYFLKGIPNIPHDYKNAVLIRLSIRYFLSMVFLSGCAFLGVWLVSRRKRKTGQQLLPGDEPKAVP